MGIFLSQNLNIYNFERAELQPSRESRKLNLASAAEVVHSPTLSFSNLTEALTEGKKQVLSLFHFLPSGARMRKEKPSKL